MLPDQRLAIDALLRRSGRNHVPIRRSFVQRRDAGGGSGPLALFVTARRRRALDLYLLAHAVISAEPWDVRLPVRTWGRLLGLSGPSASTTVGRQWKWLDQQRLVDARRAGDGWHITLLREDATGKPYSHPGIGAEDGGADGDYFRLPYAYWEADMQDWSDTPTKAVLLIALSLSREFVLPLDHADDWYGLSRDSLRAGLRGLLTRGFLDVRLVRKSAPLSAAGHTYERRYQLRGPFARS